MNLGLGSGIPAMPHRADRTQQLLEQTDTLLARVLEMVAYDHPAHRPPEGCWADRPHDPDTPELVVAQPVHPSGLCAHHVRTILGREP